MCFLLEIHFFFIILQRVFQYYCLTIVASTRKIRLLFIQYGKDQSIIP